MPPDRRESDETFPLMIADGREFRNVLRYNGRLARQRLSTFITTDAFRRF